MGYSIKRTDSNQKAIVEQFRQHGCVVQILSEVGKGCPDILVGYRGVNVIVELKDGKKPPSQRKLTKDEQKFHIEWRGWSCVVENQEDVVRLVRLMLDVSLMSGANGSYAKVISEMNSAGK